MAVNLHRAGFDHAKELVGEGKVVLDERDDWSEHQPSVPLRRFQEGPSLCDTGGGKQGGAVQVLRHRECGRAPARYDGGPQSGKKIGGTAVRR